MDDLGEEYFFSDTLNIAFSGASTIISAAITSATMLYALI